MVTLPRPLGFLLAAAAVINCREILPVLLVQFKFHKDDENYGVQSGRKGGSYSPVGEEGCMLTQFACVQHTEDTDYDARTRITAGIP